MIQGWNGRRGWKPPKAARGVGATEHCAVVANPREWGIQTSAVTHARATNHGEGL